MQKRGIEMFKTVSTKLKTDEHKQLLELCNQEGQLV